MPVLAKSRAYFAELLSVRKLANFAWAFCGGVIMAATLTEGAHAAAPVPWQMDLQPPAGSMAEMATIDRDHVDLTFCTGVADLRRGSFPCKPQSKPNKNITQYRD